MCSNRASRLLIIRSVNLSNRILNFILNSGILISKGNITLWSVVVRGLIAKLDESVIVVYKVIAFALTHFLELYGSFA